VSECAQFALTVLVLLGIYALGVSVGLWIRR